jgi:photosystem II stability/assembly factor-like uncharacterized protein
MPYLSALSRVREFAKHGFVGGRVLDEGRRVRGGQLLMTSDGGSHWTSVAGAPALAQNVYFSNPADGFLGTPGKVWHTTDGGKTWSLAFTEPSPAPSAHPPAPDITVLECAGDNAAWVLFLGYGAALGHAPYLAYATQDAKSWRVLFEESYIQSAARPGVHAPRLTTWCAITIAALS